MRKLPLIFRSNWQQKESEIKTLRRKFHTIFIESVEINEQLADTLQLLAISARELEIDSVKVTNGLLLSKILNSMQKLEKITIDRSTTEFEEDTTPSSLASLKTFNLIKSDWSFLDFFRNTHVRALKISGKNYNTVNAISFKDFMEKQSLDSLSVSVDSGNFFIDLEKVAEKNRHFELKKLAIDFKYWDNETDRAFTSFLRTNSSTLETLEITQELSHKVLETIMQKLKIKRLIIDGNRLPSKPSCYRIRPNKYLKTLVIKNLLDKLEVVQGILSVYSTIEKLVIEQWSDEVINETLIFLANNNKNLQHLEIPNLSDSETPELAIVSLKTFRVDFVGKATEWQTFCVSNPTIESLIVKWSTNRDEFTYEIFDTVTRSLTNLKNILFGVYFKPTTRILEMMARNCRNFKLLEVFDDFSGEDAILSPVINDFKVHYYNREAISSLFKEEPSMWADGDIDKSDDDDQRNLNAEDDFGNDFSSEDEIDTEDEDFIDDDDAGFEAFGYGNFGYFFE